MTYHMFVVAQIVQELIPNEDAQLLAKDMHVVSFSQLP